MIIINSERDEKIGMRKRRRRRRKRRKRRKKDKR